MNELSNKRLEELKAKAEEAVFMRGTNGEPLATADDFKALVDEVLELRGNLQTLYFHIRERPCPGRHFDECKPGGCMGGGQVCSFHRLLDVRMLEAMDRNKERRAMDKAKDVVAVLKTVADQITGWEEESAVELMKRVHQLVNDAAEQAKGHLG